MGRARFLGTHAPRDKERERRLPDTEANFKTIEFKWAGVIIPGVAIAPGGTREFDAFYVLHERPTNIQFNTFSDSSDYIPMLPEEAALERRGHRFVRYADDCNIYVA